MVLKYAQMPLDRCSHRRTDMRWLMQQFEHEEASFVLVDKALNLFDESRQPDFLSRQYLQLSTPEDCVFLGLDGKTPLFAIDFRHLKKAVQNRVLQSHHFSSLLAATAFISYGDASILGLAKAIMFWRGNHGFCGRCGYSIKNSFVEAGHSRQCRNEECGHQTFPRTDPAVIMLVQYTFDDGITRCLLGRHKSWPEGVYSTLAGFVDPGESLEEAVAREVEEEAGIRVKDVKYLDSQPWPFPSSIMLGFTATAVSGDICVNKDELDDARWFSRVELDSFTEWGDDTPGFKKTGKESISRFLLDYWHMKWRWVGNHKPLYYWL